MKNHILLAVLTTASIFIPACKPTQEHQLISSTELPSEFSEYYEMSFSKNPNLIAKRFFTAFDNMEMDGAVTADRALKQLKFHRAAQRASTLAMLMAHDLNGDGTITSEERSTIAALPESSKRWVKGTDLNRADKDNNDNITMDEMLRFSHKYSLETQAAKDSIESYLPLFDINNDGVTTRIELQESLRESYRISQNLHTVN